MFPTNILSRKYLKLLLVWHKAAQPTNQPIRVYFDSLILTVKNNFCKQPLLPYNIIKHNDLGSTAQFIHLLNTVTAAMAPQRTVASRFKLDTFKA